MSSKNLSYSKTFVTSDLRRGAVISTNRISISHAKTRTGGVLPKYRQVIASGQNATNLYTGTLQESKLVPAYPVGQARDTLTTDWYSIAISNPAYFPQFDFGSFVGDANANNRALMEIVERVREAQRAISGPTFAAEFRDTLRMLKSPAQGIRNACSDYLDSVLKRKRRNPRSWNKELAGQWLELQFGLRPLISDSKAAADAIARLATDYRRSRVSSAGFEEQAVPTSVFQYTRNSFLLRETINTVRSCRVTYKVGMRAKMASPMAPACERLKDVLGFNLSEFAPAAWEVLPWSFVIDYFTNVGAIISAATLDQSLITYISKGVKQINTRKMDMDCLAVNTPYVSISGQGAGGYTSRYSTFVRSVPLSLSIPSLTMRIPGVGQVTNLAALFLARRKIET